MLIPSNSPNGEPENRILVRRYKSDMKSIVFIVSFGLVLGIFIGCAPEEQHQLGSVSGPMAIDNMEIDSAIALVTDNHQKKMLSDFKRHFPPDDSMRVTDQGGRFEIIVSHPSRDNYSGGAEQYFLDKATGRYEMGWHEHPMPLQIPEGE